MMYFYIFTEGNSESNYIQLLRRFIRNKDLENDFILSFNKKEDCFRGLGNGYQSVTSLSNTISQKIKKSLGVAKKDRKDKDIIIWIDYDVLHRNRITPAALLTNLKSRLSGANIKIYYNVMNFEDFFVLHYTEKVEKWSSICSRENHFIHPMPSEKHFKLFIENIFPDYSKSDFLPDFSLSLDVLQNVIENSKSDSNYFESDITDLLEKILEKLE